MAAMNRNRAIQWLYSELPRLEQVAVISPDTAARIREYYGPVTVRSRRQLALLLLAILGALLIGLGIILLLAHNWDNLSRTIRSVLSFTPLVVGQILVGWTLLQRRDSLPWREGSGLFLSLSVGASIALISQTYHISGDMSTFLLTWIILAGPILYLLNATSVALLYIAGITAWLGAAEWDSTRTIWFWFLAAFLIPHIWQAYDRDVPGARMNLLSFAICIASPIAVGILLERQLPGLWIPIYSGLFAIFLISGRMMFRDSKVNAFSASGFLGVVIMGIIFTYMDVWRHVGWNHYRGGHDVNTWGIAWDYVFALLAVTVVAILLARSISRKDRLSITAACLPLLATIGFIAVSSGIDDAVVVAFFNLYVAILGGVVVWIGFNRDRILDINIGMAIFTLLIIVRFFDAQISFTVRGVLFIVVGIVFLSVNLYLSRRRKEAL